MENKVYRLFGEKGMMEEINPVGELPIGTRILAFGAGMCETEYCVTGNKTAHGQEICLISNYNENGYFSSPRRNLDNYCQPLSKKFGIGFYWDDIENIVFSESKVKAAIRMADNLVKQIDKKIETIAAANHKEIEELPLNFPYLTPINKKEDGYKQIRANIVSELKHNFPETKFSIRKPHYGTIYVSWTDGASRREVGKVIGKFEDHVTDETGDFRDYEPSNFNRVFGGLNFIFLEREYSFDNNKLIEELAEKIKYSNQEASDDIYKIKDCKSFPQGATNFRVERSEIDSGSISDCYTIAYDIPIKEETKKAVEIIKTDNIYVKDYSDKSFVVYGNTKPIKDQLKELGGKFNMRLKISEITVVGWIFPKTKKEAVISALGL